MFHIGAKLDFNGMIYPSAFSCVEDIRYKGRARVIDKSTGTSVSDALFFDWAMSGCHHKGACMFGKLDGKSSYRPGSAADKNSTPCHVTEACRDVACSECRNAECCPGRV